jgi:single-strand DNA-binding protein
MMGQAAVTVIGNATQDPELRFTPSGAAVVTFSVADNPRKKNQQTQQWENGESTFYRVTAWRQMAENIAESVRKGDRLVVVGVLQNRRYETQEGAVRFSLEINADAVALDTRFAMVTARKPERQQANGQGYQQQGSSDPWDAPPQQQRQQPQGYDDPWGSPPVASAGQGGGFADEPPFHHNPEIDRMVF